MISEVLSIKVIVGMLLSVLIASGIYYSGSFTIGEDVYASNGNVVTINGEEFVLDNEVVLTEEEKGFLSGLEGKVTLFLEDFFVFALVEIPNGQIHESEFMNKIENGYYF